MRRLNSLLGVVLLLLVVLVGVPVAFAVSRHSGPFTGTIAVGTSPMALAIDERTGHAFVVNRDDATVSMLDVARGRLVRTVPAGTMPVAVAVDERTARAFVVASNTSRLGVELGPGTVSVLDTRTGALLRTVTVGYEADAVAVDAPTYHVFVANGDGASVSILDAGSGRVLRTVAVGLAPGPIAVDTATRRVFVASRGGITV